MADLEEPRLYGITSENSNRSGEDLWGKNQFNSTFPLALCLKMRDDGVRPVYVHLDPSGKTITADDQVTMEEIVGKESEEYYSFESKFPPYEKYASGNESIDIVVSKRESVATSPIPVRPLEVKLTVVPDSSTVKRIPEEWAPELVVRPISSAFAMMGIASRLLTDEYHETRKQVKDVLDPCCQKLQRNDWINVTAILQNAEQIVETLDSVTKIVPHIQKPYLIQPIWRTEGQSLMFSDQCLDVFVWSDLAIIKIPLDQIDLKLKRMSRYLREIARHVSALYSVCTTGSFNYNDTYGGMDLSLQTDKSFSVSGKITRRYLKHPRLINPHYSKDVIKEIILNEGEKKLKPERRLDAALVTQLTLAQSMGLDTDDSGT